jgi:hypothetical protein
MNVRRAVGPLCAVILSAQAQVPLQPQQVKQLKVTILSTMLAATALASGDSQP